MTEPRLITFGCSLTYGVGLKDRRKQSWSAKLGNMLGLKVINNGIPGACNKQIYIHALKQKYSKNDVVVFSWSFVHRHTIITNYRNLRDNVTLRMCQPGATKKQKQVLDTYFLDIWQERDAVLNFHTQANHIDLLLKSVYNCKVYHLVQSRRPYTWTKIHHGVSDTWNFINFPQIYLEDIRSQYPLGTDEQHPGQECHAEYAKQIYEWIKNETS